MYHYPTLEKTPKRDYWKSKITAESEKDSSIHDYHKNQSPLSNQYTPYSERKQYQERIREKEQIKQTLENKFRDVYETPGKNPRTFDNKEKKYKTPSQRMTITEPNQEKPIIEHRQAKSKDKHETSSVKSDKIKQSSYRKNELKTPGDRKNYTEIQIGRAHV